MNYLHHEAEHDADGPGHGDTGRGVALDGGWDENKTPNNNFNT